MFEKILAAIDSDRERSLRVVAAAGELARAFGSEVLVAHVRELERPAPMVVAVGRPGATRPALHLEGRDEARRLVAAAVERLRGEGVQARGQVAFSGGSTARELLAIAHSQGATLIVVGDRGSHVGDLLLGRVSHRILHLADCPVFVVR